MRFFTFFVSLLFISSFATGQTFRFRIDSMYTTVQKDEFENYISNFGVNTTNETKIMRWTQKTIFKGSSWSNSQVCDNNLCYTDKILTRTIEIPAGDSTLLKILFRPNGQDTCGYYTISIQENGSGEIDETAHYFFNGQDCEAVAGFKRLDNVETVRIFPNPSADYVQLSSKEAVRNVTIYNAQGLVAKEVQDYRNGLIPVGDLPVGTYYMMFSFYNGKTGVSKLFKN